MPKMVQESDLGTDLAIQSGVAADTQIALSGALPRRLATALSANGVGNRIVDETGVVLAVWPTGTAGWVLTQNGKLRAELEACNAPGL